MLTTSSSEKDKTRCIELKANAFLHKPVDLNDFLKLIMASEIYWRNRIINSDGKKNHSKSDGCSGIVTDGFGVQSLNLDCPNLGEREAS
jgi:hypothetical protein